MKTLILACALIATSSVFAAAEGAGGHGGDPADVMALIKKKPTQVSNPELRNEVQDYLYQKALKALHSRQQESAKQVAYKLAVVVSNTYQILHTLKYPFEFPGEAPSPEMISKTLAQITSGGYFESAQYVTMNNDLLIDGHEVMFRSNPEKYALDFNFERFLETTTKKDTKTESVEIIAARLGTLFHEALIINHIETSRSYPFSNKFALAMRAMMTDPKFGDWIEYTVDKNKVNTSDLSGEIKALTEMSKTAKFYRSGLKGNDVVDGDPLFFRPFIWSETVARRLGVGENETTLECSYTDGDIYRKDKNFPRELVFKSEGKELRAHGILKENGKQSIQLEDGSHVVIAEHVLEYDYNYDYNYNSDFHYYDVYLNHVKANTKMCTYK